MAEMVKIIINNSGEQQEILGVQVADQDQYLVPKGKWLDLAEEDDIFDMVTSGDYIINNGTENLSSSSGLTWIKSLASDNSSQQNYDGPKGATIQLSFIDNGSNTNEWLKLYGENIPSSQTFGILPFDCKLIGITWSNRYPNRDTEVELWVSGEGDGTIKTRVYSLPIIDKRYIYKTDFDPEILFDAGDKVGVYAKDTGSNPNDVVVTLYFRVTSNDTGSGGENFSGNFAGGGGSS